MKWLILAVGILVVIVGLIALIGAMLPKGHTASRSSRFPQPPQTVWDVITGPPDWRPDIRASESLPSPAGHRAWKETDRHGQVIAYESVEEIPPRRLVTRMTDPKLPFGGTWTQEITPDARGCVLTITENGEIYNPIFRFMTRFVFGYSGTIDGYMKALHAKLGEVKD